ncbi:RHS repeat protein [Pseudomonas sp. GD04058]|uniref:RHS repeat-associated core domain-containing protein n=1 Tax=Pseudomonas sp. GD04058 TaxID=2975429 RepID=UPI00244B9B4A|nr:RHS repeat-associated core domain-containing protein [Pseudomonas sp. GD04058]MDG9883638.1 RHS repeat protein [Pseudomonas sp. GD04058]
MNTAPATHRHTPTLQAFDARGLKVRDIAYLRHPDEPQIASLVTRHRHDPRGFALCSADPRLHAQGLWNVAWHTDLAGQALCTRSLDSGLSLVLNDAARRPAWQTSHIRLCEDDSEDFAEAVTRTWCYEEPDLRARPLTITEQAVAADARIVERFVYATATPAEQARNLAGLCVRHFDPAGVQVIESMALAGVPLSVGRLLLEDADNVDSEVDWQDATLPGEPAYTSLARVDALGAPLVRTDAAGHAQGLVYDLAGQVRSRWLAVKGGEQVTVAEALDYDAVGNLLHETHGNGVRVDYRYEAQTLRLLAMRIERPAGHPLGAALLQDLHYEYDPVGNLLRIADEAESPRFWRNQRVLPESLYRYDSLYRLVEASGREMATVRWEGGRPWIAPVLLDEGTYTHYTRSYQYDRGGNLSQIRHASPAAASSHSVEITVSERSNRALLASLAGNPQEVEALFSAAGAQRCLQPGQALRWTLRAELRSVGADQEHYRYDASSQRVLKCAPHSARRVLYLPGLELRTTGRGETLTEDLHVIHPADAEGTRARLLHWQSGKPEGIDNDQLRYSYTTLTGSCGLELDGHGALISREEYYPYGGTSVWAARNAVEAGYKTLRYSGKERDASGLCYFGYRYYQPWVGRWLSADPAGTVDGLNSYAMVGNNPVSFFDAQGLMKQVPQATGPASVAAPWPVLANGLAQFSSLERHQVIDAVVEADEVMAKAIRPEPLPADEMQLWFGPGYRLETPEVLRTWEETARLAPLYRSPAAGYGKFHRMFSNNPTSVAGVLNGDVEGRIFLDDFFFSSCRSGSDRAISIIHELSHLKWIPSLGVTGAGTVDHFYMPVLDPRDYSNAVVNEGRMTEHDVSDGRQMLEDLAVFEGISMIGFIDTTMFYNANGSMKMMTLSEGVSRFSANPQLRARIASRNADSIAYAASAIAARR